MQEGMKIGIFGPIARSGVADRTGWGGTCQGWRMGLLSSMLLPCVTCNLPT